METIHRDYAPKGVKLYFIYKSLAHPEHNGYVAPVSLEERLLHIQEAKRTLGASIPWLCDTMANDLKHALGDAPNSEFVVDPEGKVARARVWSRPDELRADLEKLVGQVDKPTRVSDLRLPTEPPPRAAPRQVVPRVERPAGMQALRLAPQPGDAPFYVKLRAEASSEFARSRSSKLHLGFHLDPLFHAHWNNLTAPPKFTVAAPAGVVVSPASGAGPKVKAPADSDPREFLLDLRAETEVRAPLVVTVSYFACNDEEGWCKPVTQTFEVWLEPDADAGWPLGRGRPRPRP